MQVLRERGEQVKFERKLKEIEDEREKVYAGKLKADVEKYKEELQAKQDQEILKKAKLNAETCKE